MTRNAWILAAIIATVVLVMYGRADLVDNVLDAVPDDTEAPVPETPDAPPVESDT